ncbi:M20 family metallopeptidase [Desulfonatronovibrio hydrogenovorans]|uniref:M20 family metallopeptidase n=1 Tax=Desulfonatronovibrio hydrogenovorans TaxID=53245 RepID=UPI000AB56E61|nr:M20/M25/M40 family metallo-hydrolase [Desulfonatronovibrio hydrogenovorans]
MIRNKGRLDRVLREIDPVRLKRVLTEMIGIYSPSGKERDLQLYLEDLLQKSGFDVQKEEVEDDRFNLHLVIGSGRPDLYFIGHVDTVAYWDFDEQTPEEQGGVIRGLGAADMKGGCAAMVETCIALGRALKPEEMPCVGMCFVVGEEEIGDGSQAFLEKRRPEWVVIPEPTSLAACYSHYGYLEAVMETTGKKSHSSLPEFGHNAVESMLKVLLHLGRQEVFLQGKSDLVYSIREMTSSQAGFVVPDRCETWIDIHLPPEVDPKTIKTIIRKYAAEAHEFITDLSMEISFDTAYQGYDLGADNHLSGLLKPIYEELGVPYFVDVFRSHSDGNLFHQAGVKPVILGPGSLETAHTPDEHTSLAEVVGASRIFAALCLALDRNTIITPSID